MAAEGLAELRDTVLQTLRESGVLGKIKACHVGPDVRRRVNSKRKTPT